MSFTNPPLSGSDIIARFHGKTKVLLYDKLKDYDDIDELLSPYGHCFILLRSKPEFGHWICLKLWPDDRVVSFFDSYGNFPDDQKQHVNQEFLVSSGQAFNYICRLLHKASFKYTVEFSQYHLQAKDRSVATCGQWCCLFVEYNGPGVDGFYEYIKSFGEPNLDWVCLQLFYSEGRANKRIKL